MVKSAEALMTDARAVLTALGLTAVQQTPLIGKLDVRCAWHLMKLGKAGEGRNFGSLAEVAQVHLLAHVSIVCKSVITFCAHELAPCLYKCD